MFNVSDTLFETYENEAQLVFMLSHEIGHLVHNRPKFITSMNIALGALFGLYVIHQVFRIIDRRRRNHCKLVFFKPRKLLLKVEGALLIFLILGIIPGCIMKLAEIAGG